MSRKYKNWWFFMLIMFLYGFFAFLSNKFLFSEEFYVEVLSEKYSYQKIQELLTKNREWSWVAYVLLPIPYIIKFSFAGITLYIALYLSNIKILFSELFRIVLLAEFVFLLQTLIKLLWFIFIQTDYTIDDLQYFNPLSAINMFDYDKIEPYMFYPLKLINLFELIYWVVLAYGLSKIIKQNISNSMKIVLSSYVPALLVWMCFKIFMYIP